MVSLREILCIGVLFWEPLTIVLSVIILKKSNMNVQGRIFAILPIATGEGKNGTWRSQDAVLETEGQYPKKVCFNLFGDKIEQFPLTIGQLVNVHFEIDSREYNGRWFTGIKAWKIESGSTPAYASAAAPVAVAQSLPNDAAVIEAVAGGDDDLPF